MFAEEMKPVKALSDVIDDLEKNGRKIIFTMGKGGVGKTTAAAAIAMGLAGRGHKVHLTTTDPAAHAADIVDKTEGLTVSRIDEGEALQQYRRAVLDEAKANGLGTADLPTSKKTCARRVPRKSLYSMPLPTSSTKAANRSSSSIRHRQAIHCCSWNRRKTTIRKSAGLAA